MGRSKALILASGGLLLGLLSMKRTPKSSVVRPSTPTRRNILDVARDELARWAGITEESPEGRALVRKYWSAVGRDEDAVAVPWSGAFITWVANDAIPESLLRTGGHAAYAAAGIRNNNPDKYSTFPADRVPVKPGDIIIKPRQGEHRDFSELRGPFFPSHGDLVLEVRDGEALAVGGNKGNSVRTEIYKLNPDGTAPKAFALMRLRRDYPMIIAEVPGYRRAAFSEIPADSVKEAQRQLPFYAPGETLFGPGYAIAFETHFTPDKGPHKGASVLLPTGEIIDDSELPIS